MGNVDFLEKHKHSVRSGSPHHEPKAPTAKDSGNSLACLYIGDSHVAVEGAGLVLGGPNADQIAGDVVALGDPLQCLATEILLRHLALELHRIAAVFGHGLSPRKPGRDSPILAPSPAYPQGCSLSGVASVA